MQNKKPINIQIGQNIRQIREDTGLTQERLADILGIGDKHVSAIERHCRCRRTASYLAPVMMWTDDLLIYTY